MTRTKEIKTTITSDREADQVLMQIAQLDHKKMEVESWATEQEQKIREQAKNMLLLDKKSGETVDDKRTALEANLLAYVGENRERFQKKRSMELTHGTIGYRLGTPKVGVVGSITQKAILTTAALKDKLKRWGFIAVKESLDKKAILSAYTEDKDKTLKKLREVSMEVTQDDEAWFEPRRTEIAAASNVHPMAAA